MRAKVSMSYFKRDVLRKSRKPGLPVLSVIENSCRGRLKCSTEIKTTTGQWKSLFSIANSETTDKRGLKIIAQNATVLDSKKHVGHGLLNGDNIELL